MAKQILSGIQQSVYASYAEARNAGYAGKLLFARVSGAPDSKYASDANGNLVYSSATTATVKGKTYVFLGKKCYGSFPQLPLQLIDLIGITPDEALSGSVSSLSQYYTSSSITEILKEIAQKNVDIESPNKTITVGIKEIDSSKGLSATTLEANIDNVSIVSGANGVLSVASSAVSAVVDVKVNDPSSAVMKATTAITTGNNSAITMGLSGGETGQVIKKTSAGTYEWAYENSTEVTWKDGVSGKVTTDPTTGAKSYELFSDLSISSVTSGEGSGLVTTYSLIDSTGKKYGKDIKTINDVFLKDVKLSAQTTGDVTVSGMAFVWYVRDPENPSGTATASTFVPLSDLDTYNAGSGITIVDETNTIVAKISTDEGNLLKYSSADSGLTITAVSAVTINGEKKAVEDVVFVNLASAVTPTVNGTAKTTSFSGEITTGGMLNLNIALSGEDVAFDSTNTKKVNPAISGDDVQEVIEEIVTELSASTSGVLTVTVNGKDSILTAGTYNPSANTTIYVPQLSALTVGAESFEFNTSATSAHINTISASALTFNYTDNKNSAYTGTDYTVNSALTQIINDLAEVGDNKISGLSAISAYTNASGDTTIQLDLNPSNTTSQAGGIISSEDGAKATGSTLGDSTKSTNAVKMSQDSANGLFVYIEIEGDDMDDDPKA